MLKKVKNSYQGKENLIIYLLVGGGGAFVVGVFFTLIAVLLQAVFFFALGPLLIFAGIVVGGYGLFLGATHNHSVNSGAMQVQGEGRVTARYAINGIGEMIFDNFDYDADEARFYVRLLYLDGRRDELECERSVFDQCGEGMRGHLTILGSRLVQFVPLMDTDETRSMYRNI